MPKLLRLSLICFAVGGVAFALGGVTYILSAQPLEAATSFLSAFATLLFAFVMRSMWERLKDAAFRHALNEVHKETQRCVYCKTEEE